MIILKQNDSPKLTREYLDFINKHKDAYRFEGEYNEVLQKINSGHTIIMQGKFYDVYSENVLVGFLQLLISDEDKEGDPIEINFGIFDDYKGNNFCEECLKEYFKLDISKRYITQAVVRNGNLNKEGVDKILLKLGFKITYKDNNCIEYSKL